MRHSTPLTFLKSYYLLLSSIMFISVSVHAQNGHVRGRVTTIDDKPAAYVNVLLKEVNLGTTTAEDGSYMIKNVKEGSYTLITSFIGLQSQEQIVTIISGQTTKLDFKLSENAKQLAEIVITDSKNLNERPVSVGKIAIKPMDLPQSVMVINRDIMDQQQTLRLSDVLRNTNGVYVMGTTGGTQEELAGRGFSFNSNNTFKNGVRFNNGVMPETNSLERVEVMKGSSAILFGNVAAGGVLNLVTKKPKFENGGEVSLRIGSYDFYKPSLDIYGAVNNSDKVAYRINTTYENAKSYRDEVKAERFYINPSFLVKLGKKTDILLEGDFLKDNRTPDFGVGVINYQLIDVPRNRYMGVSWATYQTEQKSATATITHHLNNNWQLKAVGGYQNYDNSQYSNTRPNASGNMIKTDGTWVRNLQRSRTKESYVLAQLDLTGQFTTGILKHNFLAGADFDKYQNETFAFDIYANPSSDKPNAAYDSINVFDLNVYEQRQDMPKAVVKPVNGITKTPTQRSGMYVQDLISISEQFKVLAGARFTYMESGNNPKRYDDAVTPRLGVVYQPLKSTSIFASYSNAFNLNTAIDNTGKTLSPSFINQYEIGIKNDLFKGLLSANITLYQIVNSNLSQSILQDSPNYNPDFPNAQELAGEVTSKGIEVDMMTKSFQGFSFIGGYSYNQTKYTKSNTYEVGSKLRYNPAHTANASVYYVFQNTLLKGFNLGLTGFYNGDMMAGRNTRLTVANDTYKLIVLPSFFQFDASVGYTINKVGLRVRVTNIFNKLAYYAHDDNSINPIAPRMFAATISYKL